MKFIIYTQPNDRTFRAFKGCNLKDYNQSIKKGRISFVGFNNDYPNIEFDYIALVDVKKQNRE